MKRKNIFCYLFISLFCIIISAPLLKEGVINGHDLKFHLSRILSVSDGFANGNFLNYIHYGYLNIMGMLMDYFIVMYLFGFLRYLNF